MSGKLRSITRQIAIVAAIHGNVAALRAVLQDLEREGIDAAVVAGDHALFGPRPGETIELLRGLPYPAIYGNTDRYILDDTESLICWVRQDIGESGLEWLGALPFEHRVPARNSPDDDLLVVHATPTDVEAVLITEPDEFGSFELTPEGKARDLVGDARAGLMVYGHIHYASAGQVGDLRVASVRAVGMPTDGDPRAGYGVVSWDGRSWRLEHRCVAYDHESVADEILASDTPLAEVRAERIRRARFVPLDG